MEERSSRVEEGDDVRSEDLAGHADAADLGGEDDAVGAGLHELLLGAGVGALGDDAELGVEGACGDGAEEVVAVAAEGDDGADGALNVGFAEEVVLGGVSDEVGELLSDGGLCAVDGLLAALDDDEGCAALDGMVESWAAWLPSTGTASR